jgi:membrane fusion protein (multidrug efflux system)
MHAIAEPPKAAASIREIPKLKPQKKNRMSKKNLIRAVIAAALVTAIGLGARQWHLARSWVSTDDAYIAAHVQQVSSRLAARVQSVPVKDNQFVRAGDVLVRLDKRDLEVAVKQAEAKLKSARANVAKAEAQILAAEAGAGQAVAELESKQVEAENAETDLTRNRNLRKTGAVSQKELDNAETEARTNRSDAVAAQQRVATVKAGIRYMTASLDAAKSAVAEADSGLEKAKLDLSYATITATQDGRVTAKSVEPGNFVQPGQALMAIVSNGVWVEANFKETQLAEMRAGQEAIVRVDAYPDLELHGHVDSIQAGSGAQFSLLPPENATGNFVKVVQRVPVKITLELPEKNAPLLGPGMSVVPQIRVRR